MNKNYNTWIVIVLIIVLGLFQYSYFKKVNDVQTSINQIRNEISAIRGDVSQQFYQINAEKADYLLDGIEFYDAKYSDSTKTYSTQMKISFSKLPADANCTLEVVSTSDHYPVQNNLYGPSAVYENQNDSQMVFGDAKIITLISDQKNIFTADLSLEYEKNYEYIFVIETPTQIFREKLGAIPLLEWIDPIYNAEVNYNEYGVRSPDNGYIKYTVNVYRLIDQINGNLFINDKILVYPDNERLNLKGISNISYKVLYDNAVIKEGVLEQTKNTYEFNENYQASNSAEFTAGINDDLAGKFTFEFTITGIDGKVTTLEKKMNY